MKEADKGNKLFVIIILIGLILSAAAFFILNKTFDQDIFSNKTEETNATNNQTIIEITECSDYKNQEDCESNPEEVSLVVGCVWDAVSKSCNLAKPDDLIKDIILDISAVSLNLTTLECRKVNITEANITVKECDLNIVGIFKNTGKTGIEKDFSVHLLDITAGTVLIKTEGVADRVAPQEEREIRVVYNTTAGDHWIKFVVDPSFKLNEANETNNEITGFIDVG